MKSQTGSLERTTILLSLLAVAVALVGASLFVYRTVERQIERDSDANLETILRLASSRVTADARRALRERDGILKEAESISGQRYHWLVMGWRPGNPDYSEPAREIARTLTFPLEGAPAPLADTGSDRLDEYQSTIERTEGGSTYRVASLLTVPSGGPQGGRSDDRGRGPGRRGPPGRGGPPLHQRDRSHVFVATPIDNELRVLSNLASALALASGLAVLASLLMLRFAVKRGLRPIGMISKKIEGVDAAQLGKPLAVGAVPAELVPIVDSFEGLRERLDAAFVREQRFTSDAAHELRTPLAGLRASLEVALRRERSAAEYRASAEECLDVTVGMQDMVDALLQLARGADSSQEHEALSLRTLVEESVASIKGRLEDRQMVVCYEGDVEGRLTTHRQLLLRAVHNVVMNAADHGSRGGTIQVLIGEDKDTVSLRISNPANHLTDEVGQRAFEPLWRADPSREQSGGHSGLGLALVQQCVDALGGSTDLVATRDEFALTLTMPKDRDGSHATMRTS